MQLSYRSANSPELTFESFRELVAAYRAVDDYYPEHPLVRPPETHATRRMTLPEVIMAGDETSGELLQYPFECEEVEVILTALDIRALEPPSWEQANARDMVDGLALQRLGRLAVTSV